MSPFRRQLVTLFISICAVLMHFPSCNQSYGGIGDSLRERFFSEAPKKWQEYRSHTARFQGSVRDTTVDLKAGRKVTEEMICAFKQNRSAGCTLVSGRKIHRTASMEDLYALNLQYEFQLGRRDPQLGWAMAGVERIQDGKSLSSDCMSNSALDYWPQHALLFIHTYDLLPHLIEQPEFDVKSVVLVSEDSRQYARVDFDYRPQKSGPDVSPLRTGWVLLDPERFWVIVKYEVQLEVPDSFKGSIVGSMEYEKGNAVPIPKKGTQRHKRIHSDGETTDQEVTYEFHMTEADVPESEFFLSAFGLPEPFDVRQPRRWYLWAALAAVPCLALAIFLHRRARLERTTA